MEDWLTDITGRLKQVSLRQKRQQISDLEKKLETLMSSELRTEIELEKLGELLK